MSFNKGEDITTDELNGVISIFKHYHKETEQITDPFTLNILRNCTFEFSNGLQTNEEIIFEGNINCTIIKDSEVDLGEHYQLRADYYEYDLDSDLSTLPQLKTKVFDLSPIGDNQYTYTLESPVIYMQLTNLLLITGYDKPIIRDV